MSGASALALLFANVFSEQMGLPIPSYPALLVAGSLASLGHAGYLIAVLLLAWAACELADTLWYLAGRRYGHWLMGTLCRISLEPDTCIRKNRNLYLRFGPRVLIVAKFVPGLGALSTLMAGATDTPYRKFLFYDAIGSLLWIMSGLLLGLIFHKAVLHVLYWLEGYVTQGALAVAGVFLLFLAWKWWRRWLILRVSQRIPRISVDELRTLEEQGPTPVIIDVRARAFASDPIPGAIHIPLARAKRRLPVFDPETPVVIYCACPNEISATLLAERLQARGTHQTYALRGGAACWHASHDADHASQTDAA